MTTIVDLNTEKPTALTANKVLKHSKRVSNVLRHTLHQI